MKIQNTVDLNRDVVFSDTALRGHVDRLFFKRVLVGHFIDEGNQNMKTCLERLVELPKSLHHKNLALRHDPDGLEEDPTNKERDHRPRKNTHYLTSTSSTLLLMPQMTSV